MIDCEKCGRGEEQINRCVRKDCQFKVCKLKKSFNYDGLLLVGTGSLILFGFAYFPFFSNLESETFLKATFSLLMLSIGILLAIVLCIVGYFALASRRVSIIDKSNGNSWLLQKFRGVVLKLRAVNDIKRYDVKAIPKKSNSILEDKLKDQDFSILAGLNDLLKLELLKCFLANEYISIGQRLETALNHKILIFKPSENLKNKNVDLNQFQRELIYFTENWEAHKKFYQSPMGPRIVDFIEHGRLNLGSKIIGVSNEAKERLRESVLYNFFVDAVFFAKEEEEKVKAELLSWISPKNLRIASAVSVILFFSIFRYGKHVNRVFEAKRHIETAHRGVKEFTGYTKNVVKDFVSERELSIDSWEEDFNKLIKNGSEVGRLKALKLIGQFQNYSEKTLRKIEYSLEYDVSPKVRREAAKILGSITQNSNFKIDSKIKVLKKAIRDKDRETRLAAIESLGRYEENANSAVEDLTEIIMTKEGELREKAFGSLLKINPQSAESLLSIHGERLGLKIP